MNPRIDAYLRTASQWRSALERLRKILLGFPFAEEVKWGKPCYTLDGANVVIIQDFKDYCALLFFKGALLKDPRGLLIRQTENVQAARQLRFTSEREVAAQAAIIKAYVQEAIAVEKSGVEIVRKTTANFAVAEEFQSRLDRTPALQKAFAALTPGRQRGYLLYFSSAKQSATRAARVEKCLPQILKGKGLDD